MSKIARVKFIRDKEPNIKALTAENKVLDGALYVATDTGTMWMGTSATSLIQIKDNINTNTTYTLTKSGSTITLKGSDGSSVNITDSNTIYNNATASAAGLMSAADKSKLDSVATGANKTVVDTSFVDNSTNPVQSKVIKSALDDKVNKTGDTMTGRLTVPEVAATNYFVTPTMVGEGDKTKYYHRVDFGYAGHDHVDFHEYGGTWNFYQNTGGTEESKVLVAAIQPDGFHGNLKGQADLVPWSGVTNKPSFATVATSGSYNDLSNKPTIPTVPSSLKNPNALTISLNGTSQGAYDGSAVKNINITASSVGAAASSHTHTKSQITDFPTSMPASDVSAWAKADSKPSYTISEISGNLPASRISGTIAAANLPSYVDDVLEYASFSKFPTTGESGKIYTALDTNKIYRWSGSAYVVISETVALGTTHSSAGYGDESRAAYNHSTSTGNPHKTTKTDLGLGNVENKSSATIRGELTSANVTTALGYTPPKTDTNTHYTTRIVAGAANGTANAATTNGNTHINVTDDNTFRSGVVIKGTGATSVTSDASGNITVHSTDTDTWRPIQNNLTSTATDQSLSAAQGKALNDKFSSYVPTSRTVNGKALSANIALSAGDVGAAPASHSHSYLPLSGGTMTGPIKFNSNSLPSRDSQDFLVGIDAFDQGGTLKWSSASNVKVGSATKATQDSAGQQINTTYIKGLSVSGRTVTYTRGDGTTGTITTQDTNTTYNNVTTSASGLMTAADKQKLDALGGIVTTTKSITLKTDWQNTGIASNNLSTGTYVIQVSGLTSDDGLNTYSEIWSGVMSWYASSTNGGGSADEILLHNAGHADNGRDIYLRTLRNSSGVLALQIASNSNATKADNVVFKFRKLI